MPLSPAFLDDFAVFAAAFLAGLAIKIMDDHLDEHRDSKFGQPNLAAMYGQGITAYGFCALLAAAAIHLPTAVSVFAGAYIVGMGLSSSSTYLFGLSGRAESLLMLVFSIYCAGLALTGVSILIMAAIQLWDNWVDNGEHLLGLVLAGASIGGALLIDGGQSSMVLFAYALFFALERWWLGSIS